MKNTQIKTAIEYIKPNTPPSQNSYGQIVILATRFFAMAIIRNGSH